MTRCATWRIRSALPTEVPPYFWTIKAIDLIEIFDAQHDRRALDDRQLANFLERSGYRPVRRIVQHQDQRLALAFVSFRLDHRGNADPGFAENRRDLR